MLVFCSRDEPSLVCQEITIEVDADSDLALKAVLDARHVDGRALRHFRDTPGDDKPCCDGAALWESAGALSTCGIAYVTEVVGAEAEPERPPLENRTLTTSYALKAKIGTNLSIAADREPYPEGGCISSRTSKRSDRSPSLANSDSRPSGRPIERVGASCGKAGSRSSALIVGGRRWPTLLFFTCSAQPMLRHRRRPRSSVWRPGTTTIITMAT